jgi:hypothetical protein
MPEVRTTWNGVRKIAEDLATTVHPDDIPDIIKIQRMCADGVYVHLTKRQAKRLINTDLQRTYR